MLPWQHETKQMPYRSCYVVVVTYLHKQHNVKIRQCTIHISSIVNIMDVMCSNEYNTDIYISTLCTLKRHIFTRHFHCFYENN